MYDFKSHRRGPSTRKILPAPIVVVEGILLFSDAPLRETLDLKIFVDTDADVRVLRRVRRDMEQRVRQRFGDASVTVDAAGRWHVYKDGQPSR